MFYRIIVLLLLLMLCGCASGSYAKFIEGLNERQITSCVRYQGSMRAGGITTGGSVAIQGITSTGGADLKTCYDYRLQ